MRNFENKEMPRKLSIVEEIVAKLRQLELLPMRAVCVLRDVRSNDCACAPSPRPTA